MVRRRRQFQCTKLPAVITSSHHGSQGLCHEKGSKLLDVRWHAPEADTTFFFCTPQGQLNADKREKNPEATWMAERVTSLGYILFTGERSFCTHPPKSTRSTLSLPPSEVTPRELLSWCRRNPPLEGYADRWFLSPRKVIKKRYKELLLAAQRHSRVEKSGVQGRSR